MTPGQWTFNAADIPGFATLKHNPGECNHCNAMWWRSRGWVPAEPTARDDPVREPVAADSDSVLDRRTGP